MFRRWRRARLAAQASAHAAASAPRPTAADLRGEHLFELLNAKLAEFIGPGGSWSLVRRTEQDTDQIFRAMLTHQIAAELTRTVLDERESVAVVVPAENEPLALSWVPAPLVVWADPVVVAETETDAATLPSIGQSADLEARAA
ncbi:hypothetical protein [Agromyces bauzanensis]|uniref:Uncharacterized protein n=1 Tax=Agromyces bauzanensis TaxID=1308924 RepID=A0A917PA57_9MICO|nr:hypothetical protein [Agromyces bauzanensis]GGJ68311.1 hypothetical protein GCM10011372_02600 [Agromyces bauzanensis]